MNSFLIVGIYRSGSTILSSLIAEQYGCKDFGESWITRKDQKDIRIFDIVEEQKIRLKYLIENKVNWVGKTWVANVLQSTEIIDLCLENKINVVFTHRKNILDLYNSRIYAKLRRNALRDLMQENKVSEAEILQHGEFFIFNDASKIDFLRNLKIDEKITDEKYIKEFNKSFEFFYIDLVCWRLLYEKFKTNISVVSYEEEILPLNFKSIQIQRKTIEDYNKKELRYVKTPFSYNLYEKNKDMLKNINSFDRLSHLMNI